MSNAAEFALKLSQWMSYMKGEFAYTKSLLAEIGNDKEKIDSEVDLLDLLETINGISNKYEHLEENYETTRTLIKNEKSDLIDKMEIMRKIFNQFKLNFGITGN